MTKLCTVVMVNNESFWTSSHGHALKWNRSVTDSQSKLVSFARQKHDSVSRKNYSFFFLFKFSFFSLSTKAALGSTIATKATTITDREVLMYSIQMNTELFKGDWPSMTISIQEKWSSRPWLRSSSHSNVSLTFLLYLPYWN